MKIQLKNVPYPTTSSPPEVFWKYTANLQEITHAEVWFQLLLLSYLKFKVNKIYNRYIPRRRNNTIIHFSGKLSTGINPANNFDLIKMYNEKYIYLKCNGKIEGGLSPKNLNISARCIFMVYSRETGDSWCHCHKVAQYMNQLAS